MEAKRGAEEVAAGAVVRDVGLALRDLPELRIGAATSEDDAMAAMRVLASLEGAMVGVVRFSGQTPWERHSQDELLYLLEGEVELDVLGEAGPPVRSSARAGSLVVVPRGAWHRQLTKGRVTLIFITNDGEVSTAEDPRRPA